MNRFRNFPASEDMSQFEIVELQNEMLRQRKTQNESNNYPKSENSESDDDSLTENSSTMIEDQSIDLSENDIASDITEDGLDTQSLSSRLSDDNLSGSLESDSDDSNQSTYITPQNSFSQHQEIIPIDLSLIHI